MAPIHGLEDVETALEDLATRPEGPYVVRLPREPGRRESRYAQLFTGEIDLAALEAAQVAALPAAAATGGAPTLSARVDALESEVAALREQLLQLQARFDNGTGT
jgi:uncharacterized protein YceH (UPF0502 family)